MEPSAVAGAQRCPEVTASLNRLTVFQAHLASLQPCRMLLLGANKRGCRSVCCGVCSAPVWQPTCCRVPPLQPCAPIHQMGLHPRHRVLAGIVMVISVPHCALLGEKHHSVTFFCLPACLPACPPACLLSLLPAGRQCCPWMPTARRPRSCRLHGRQRPQRRAGHAQRRRLGGRLRGEKRSWQRSWRGGRER